MRKLLALVWKEVYLTFSNRSLLIIMVAAPLTIATIVGMAFGGLGGSGLTFEDIPVAIVNLDQGVAQQGQTINYGAMLVSLLTTGDIDTSAFSEEAGTPCPLAVGESGTTDDDAPEGVNISLEELFLTTELDNIEDGRSGVDSGDYAALIIVPADYSARLSPAITPFGTAASAAPTTLEVYASSGTPVSASIVNSVVRGFTSQIMGGNIAIGATITGLIETNPLAAVQLVTNPDTSAVLGCGFSGVLESITIDQQPVGIGNQESGFAYSLTTEILMGIGAAQAVFFALFTGQFGVLSIMEERQQWTLQRMLVTPTPRNLILGGNFLGTLVTIIFQISLLLLALMGIASLIEGQLALIWGTNLLAIVALVLALALCVGGIGILIVGLVKTPQQVNAFSIVFNMMMGILGGAFGMEVGPPLAYLSPIYWGMDGFTKLSLGDPHIWLNVGVLVLAGAILFSSGAFLFNRRLDI